MDSRVIHFGLDDCYRIQVLQAAGYDVIECCSLMELRTNLQQGDGAAAVLVSFDETRTAEEAATLAGSAAPVILFRRGTRTIDEHKFDCVLDTTVSPAVWLGQLAEIITRNGKLQETRRLRMEAAEERAQSRRRRARSRMLGGRNLRHG